MDRQLFAELRSARVAFALTVVLSVLTGVAIIGQAALLSRLIDALFLQGRPLGGLSALVGALAAVIVVRALLNGLADTAAARVASRIKRDLRERLMAHLFALGPGALTAESTGELSSTVTEGIGALDAYFRDYLPALITSVLIPLAVLIVVFPLDLLTFLLLLLTAPLIPLFMVLIGMAAGALARQQYAAMSRMSSHFLDVMQGLSTLKLFNRSLQQARTIDEITGRFRETTMRVLRVAFLSAFALELLATLSVAIVAVQVGLRLLNGGIPFTEALFLLVIAPEYYLPLRTLGAKFHAGRDGTAAAERIYALLNTPTPEPGTGAVPTGAIRFEDVHVQYADGRAGLRGLSLTVEPGSFTALVGHSGAGKSTVASLLLRFVQPTAGRVTIGGTDLGTVNAEAWRASLAWVGQRPYLFNRSVADNIRLGRPDAPLDDVIAAAKAAAAHDFITGLENGYDTLVGEQGARLSGGQAQRIAIARALLRDAPLLILDEATSALDVDTERRVMAAVREYAAGRTLIVIAHCLDTIAAADQIVVLAAGRAAETGTHAGLLTTEGQYREMVQA